jgi:hypothetical protein
VLGLVSSCEEDASDAIDICQSQARIFARLDLELCQLRVAAKGIKGLVLRSFILRNVIAVIACSGFSEGKIERDPDGFLCSCLQESLLIE